MPIATRADLEAVRGIRHVAELLREARDRAATLEEQLAQEAARLNEALQAGDNLIAQFLPLPADASDPRWPVLRQFAVNEALYYLEQHTQAGASAAAHDTAGLRRKDLHHMRNRDQWAGSADGQSNQRSGYVESGDPWSRRNMRGLV